jgi:hypothetical protein
LLCEAFGAGGAENCLADNFGADTSMIAAVAVDPFALFVAAELPLLFRRETLGVTMCFWSSRVGHLFGFDDYFLLWGVGSDGNSAKFTLKQVRQPLS